MCGDEHGSNRLFRNGFGVIRHSKVAFGSVEENVNVCSVPGLGSGGVDVDRRLERRRDHAPLVAAPARARRCRKMSIARHHGRRARRASSSSIRYGDSQRLERLGVERALELDLGPDAPRTVKIAVDVRRRVRRRRVDRRLGRRRSAARTSTSRSPGVGSAFSARSTARTWNVCWPGSSSTYWAGLKHSSHTARRSSRTRSRTRT